MLKSLIDEVLVTEEEINNIVSRLAQEINHDYADKNLVLDWLDKYFEEELEDRDVRMFYLKAEIPTKNGVHLIVERSFNLQKFKEAFPNIDVHKNNPTVLYVPKSLDK